MDCKNINTLRKNKQFDEALNLANACLEKQPDDRFVQQAYGWLIYENIKGISEYYDPENVTQDPSEHFKALQLTLKPYFAFKQLSRPDLLHSLLMTLLLKYTSWPHFIPVAHWFAYGNAFRPEDMQPYVHENGTKTDSLWLRFHHALAKSINNNTQHIKTDKVQWAIDSVMQAHQQHPDHLWIRYELSKRALKQGNQKEAIDYIQPLFKTKSRDGWLWGYLGDIFAQGSPDNSIALYYHAISLSYKDEVTLSIRLRLAQLLANAHQYAEATYQVKKIIEIRLANHYRIPDDVALLQHQPWFIEHQHRNDLPSDKNTSEVAKALLAQIDTRPTHTRFAVIESHNDKKHLTVCMMDYDKPVLCMHHQFKAIAKWPVGSIVELVMIEDSEDVVRINKSEKMVLDSLFMPFSGKLERFEGKDFAFIAASKKTSIFIPPFLLRNLSAQNGDLVHCMALLNLNKKQQKGWKALVMLDAPYTLKNNMPSTAESDDQAITASEPKVPEASSQTADDVQFIPVAIPTQQAISQPRGKLPTHHICLISDAPMTTIGPLIDEAIGAQSATLVFVKGSKQLVTNLQKTLSKRGISVTLFEIANMFDSRKLLEAFEILKQQHANGACLNLTGGSKLMLLAAKQVFHEPLYHQYYIHYNDSIQWLNQTDSYHPISDTIDLTDYFMAMGYEIKGRSGFNPQLKDLAWIKRLFADNLTEHLSELLSYGKGPTTLDFILPATTLPKLQALLDLLIDAGHVTQSGQRIQLSSPNTHTLLNGQWLEQWILAALAAIQEQSNQPAHQRLQDIQLGLKLSNSDFTYAEVNTPNNQQSIDNELDISCLYNNSLYLIECKAGKNVAKDSVDTALYKLHARKEQLGGLKGKALLISLYPLSEQKKTLAASLDISVIDGSEQLKNPISTLKSWLEQD